MSERAAEAGRPATVDAERIRLGVSSCLLGHEVRYNGGHKRDRYVTDVLANHFELVPFCPELAVGLGVPRPPIRLAGDAEAPRAVRTDDASVDVTDSLAAYGSEIGRQVIGISGYLLKARSPSCGMERVKVYDANGRPSATGRGIYASALMREQPLLPVEEEGRLNDPPLRDCFITRVCVFHRWQRAQAEGLTPAALVAFHTEHKFLLLAHHQQAMRELGRLVAEAGRGALEDIAGAYVERLMGALARPAKRASQTNALQHMAGFFKKRLDAGDRAELADAIERYRTGSVPILVPLTLIRHHLRRNPDAYLEGQQLLDAHARTLDAGPPERRR